MHAFSQTEITEALKTVPSWQLVDGAIERKFQFADFVAAFGWLTQVAILAEKSNHHPEIFNVYNRVIIRLNTHDVDGISAKDFALASAIDQSFDG